MSTEKTEALKSLSEASIAAEAIVATHVVISGDAGTVGEEAEKAHLSAHDIPLDLAKKVVHARNSFTVGVQQAGSKAAYAAMKNDPKLDQVTIGAKFLGDDINVTIKRNHTQPKAPGSSEMVTVKGHVRTGVTTNGAGGQLKLGRQHLANQAAKDLAD